MLLSMTFYSAAVETDLQATHIPSPVTGESSANAGFSVLLREGTKQEHETSERSTFIDDVINQRASRADYIALVAQHYFLYEALEEAATALLAAHPDSILAELHPTELHRLDALRADLEFLLGADWRSQITPLPATAAYAARIREIAKDGWLAGYMAHHYTRYLGDLSGGQFVARRVATQHGFTDAGVEFYNFKSLGSPSAFKKTYRAGLDQLGAGLDAVQRELVLAEAQRAFEFNTAMFQELQAQRIAA